MCVKNLTMGEPVLLAKAHCTTASGRLPHISILETVFRDTIATKKYYEF